MGGANVAEEDGVTVREDDEYDEEVLPPTTARSELFLGNKDGRCGRGGAGRDRSG